MTFLVSKETCRLQEGFSVVEQMADTLSELVNAILRWWEKVGANNRPTKKKFEVNERFNINNRGGANSRFRLAGATRPKRCPNCLTGNSITRTQQGRWHCKACDHEWD